MVFKRVELDLEAEPPAKCNSNANEKSPNITLCSTMKKEKKGQQLYN